MSPKNEQQRQADADALKAQDVNREDPSFDEPNREGEEQQTALGNEGVEGVAGVPSQPTAAGGSGQEAGPSQHLAQDPGQPVVPGQAGAAPATDPGQPQPASALGQPPAQPVDPVSALPEEDPFHQPGEALAPGQGAPVQSESGQQDAGTEQRPQEEDEEVLEGAPATETPESPAPQPQTVYDSGTGSPVAPRADVFNPPRSEAPATAESPGASPAPAEGQRAEDRLVDEDQRREDETQRSDEEDER